MFMQGDSRHKFASLTWLFGSPRVVQKMAFLWRFRDQCSALNPRQYWNEAREKGFRVLGIESPYETQDWVTNCPDDKGLVSISCKRNFKPV